MLAHTLYQSTEMTKYDGFQFVYISMMIIGHDQVLMSLDSII